MYQYPDHNDALTGQLIASVSTGDYWEKSEAEMLQHVLSLFSGMPHPINYLDLGSGLGRLIPVFAPYVDNLYALEPDPDRFSGTVSTINNIQNSYPACSIHAYNGDLFSEASLPCFNFVLCSHVIQHIPYSMTEGIVEKLSMKCNVNSYVAFSTTWNASEENRFTLEAFNESERECRIVSQEEFSSGFGKSGILPVAFYTKNTVLSLFAKYGFEPVDFYCYHYNPSDVPLSVENDRIFNRSQNYNLARDVLYIFKKA